MAFTKQSKRDFDSEIKVVIEQIEGVINRKMKSVNLDYIKHKCAEDIDEDKIKEIV